MELTITSGNEILRKVSFSGLFSSFFLPSLPLSSHRVTDLVPFYHGMPGFFAVLKIPFFSPSGIFRPIITISLRFAGRKDRIYYGRFYLLLDSSYRSFDRNLLKLFIAYRKINVFFLSFLSPFFYQASLLFIVNRSPSLNFSLNIVTIKLATLDTDRKEEEDKGGGGGKGETREKKPAAR